MSMMEEFLELQEKTAKLEKKLIDNGQEIDIKDKKILGLIEKLNDSTNEMAKSKSDSRHYRSMSSMLESEKTKLERDNGKLQKNMDALTNQIQQFTEMLETINKTLQTKEDSLLSKEEQLQKKDTQILEKDETLEKYRKMMEKLSDEKESYQAEKFDFMEKISNEKVELTEKVGMLEKSLQESEQKFKKWKNKSRQAQDGLLGASMEMENIREENAKLRKITELLAESGINSEELLNNDSSVKILFDKEKVEQYKLQVEKLKEKLGTLDVGQDMDLDSEDVQKLFERGTGIYSSVSALVAHFKFKIPTLKRTLRLILPALADIDKYGLRDMFLKLPKNALKNIACAVNKTKDKKLIHELQKHNFRITDYRDKSLFAISIDNKTASLAVYDKKSEKLTGLFSNDSDLVKLLSQAVMNPFIKGKKIN